MSELVASNAADCHILIEREPNRGSWNMAVDEALLEAAATDGRCTLRWYRWSEATISLGYFQTADVSCEHPELASLPVVRRLSGGGAILHHHELTCSIAIPAAHRLAKIPGDLYEAVHRSLILSLKDFGFPVSLRGHHAPLPSESYLCFSRGDINDIVLHGHKVFGSAQRRRRGAVLQHGSLLLRRSEHAPQFPGLFELEPEITDFAAFVETLSRQLGAALGNPKRVFSLGDPLTKVAKQLDRCRYNTLSWQHRR